VLWDHGFQEHDRKRSDQPWTARERINNWAMLGENPHHSDAGNTISFSYTPAAGSGTLTVSSGGRVVASIDMIGTYTSANFSITSGVSGDSRDRRPDGRQWRQCGTRARPGLPEARPRLAGHRLRRPDDDRLFREPHQRRRHADRDRRPPRASVALLGNYHGWKLRHHG
jgi:hypothetical protein